VNNYLSISALLSLALDAIVYFERFYTMPPFLIARNGELNANVCLVLVLRKFELKNFICYIQLQKYLDCCMPYAK
jgi:hypothetical protein